MVIGTLTSGAEQEYLMIAKTRLPINEKLASDVKDFNNKEKTLYNLLDNSSVQEKQLAESEYKDALYKFAPMPSDKDIAHKGLVSTVDRFFSKSTAPFYGMLLAIVIIILIVLNWSWIVGLFNCKG